MKQLYFVGLILTFAVALQSCKDTQATPETAPWVSCDSYGKILCCGNETSAENLVTVLADTLRKYFAVHKEFPASITPVFKDEVLMGTRNMIRDKIAEAMEAAKPVAPTLSQREMLMGKWISSERPTEEIEYSDSLITYYANGKVSTTHAWQMGKLAGKYINTMPEGSDKCYSFVATEEDTISVLILSLTPENLKISLLGTGGIPANYQRNK